MKMKMSQIRAEVARLDAAGKPEEAKALWREGVAGMGDRYEDDETRPTVPELKFIG